MKINEIDDNIIKGPWKKPEVKVLGSEDGPKPISLIQAFGNPELAALEGAGFSMHEKPDSFGELFKEKTISKTELGKIQNVIGHGLETFNAEQIINLRNGDLRYNKNDLPQTFILRFSKESLLLHDRISDRVYQLEWNDIEYFLCNTTGASTYIRFWSRLV